MSRKDLVSLSNTQVTNTYLSLDGTMPTLQDFHLNGFNTTTLSEEGEDQSGWNVCLFATTPKMSTYLVAYANGDFKYTESSYLSPLTKETIPIRIYALEDQIDKVYPMTLTFKNLDCSHICLLF